MAEKRRPIRKVKVGERFAFPVITPPFGRAEFEVCVVWRNHRPMEAFVDPLNIPELQETLHVRIHDRYFIFGSWRHQGLAPPDAWLNYWCGDHGTPSFRVYAPDGATHLAYVHDGDFRFIREPETQKPPADPA